MEKLKVHLGVRLKKGEEQTLDLTNWKEDYTFAMDQEGDSILVNKTYTGEHFLNDEALRNIVKTDTTEMLKGSDARLCAFLVPIADYFTRETGNPLKQLKKIRFAFFWRPENPFYGSFSSWSDHPIRGKKGILYHTTEHFVQYHKTMLFGDKKAAKRILRTKNSYAAKTIGRDREIVGFRQSVWDENKINIMENAITLKVKQYPDIAEKLKKTGDKIIVDASPGDPIWGIGMSEEDSDAVFPDRWKGTNLLGEVWMRVREKLLSSSLVVGKEEVETKGGALDDDSYSESSSSSSSSSEEDTKEEKKSKRRNQGNS